MSYILSFDGVEPKLADDVFVAPNATIVGDVTIGKASSVWFNAVIRGDIASIKIGDKTNIQDGCVIHTMDGENLTIGNGVTVGHNATIHSSKIGDNCLIGMGCNLMGHTEIGENCIIGAGTFLAQYKKIPPNSLVYGNPAKIVRHLRDDEIEAIQGAAAGHAGLADYYSQCLGE